ncbi:CHY zinc finger protein [Sporosarcina gallistercoris]|uniref:CHY zinc finger protein n=1 Tax=Sporosarcina gallistercoris TaxID=2762245 RepID=UPI003D271356
MNIHGQNVLGSQVDCETRCAHYHKEIDRIAIKFYCCDQYFPCFECHAHYGCSQPKQWPKDRFDQKAILCGSCGHELTVAQYLSCQSNCPNCQSEFNPGCSLHAHLYFVTDNDS